MMRAIRACSLAFALVLSGCGGSPHGDPVRFTIPPGSGVSAAADTLAARDIVSSALIFRIYAQLKGLDKSMHPGIYEARGGPPSRHSCDSSPRAMS